MQEILSPGAGEYTEKKSRFIGYVAAVTGEQEAMDLIEAKKKQYHDARHNCSAYIIADASGQTLSRFCDDGEPSGTAGRPILDVLEGQGLVNAVCVVTRYFGGVLLGTGGLVRAYTQAAKEAVAHAALMERRQGFPLRITSDYTDYGRVEYLLRDNAIPIVESRFETDVIIECIVPVDGKDRLSALVTEATGARAILTFGDEVGFGIVDGKVYQREK